jgi:hypothetical protein
VRFSRGAGSSFEAPRQPRARRKPCGLGSPVGLGPPVQTSPLWLAFRWGRRHEIRGVIYTHIQKSVFCYEKKVFPDNLCPLGVF